MNTCDGAGNDELPGFQRNTSAGSIFQKITDRLHGTARQAGRRGFAYALFPPFIESYSGDSFGYPTWLVVDPEMKLIHGNVGFSSWDDVKAVIAANGG